MAQAENCGHLAFTSYITATTTLQTQPELIERFTRTVYRTQQLMAHHSAAEIAQAIQASFADTPVDMLGTAIERFKQLSTWPVDPVLRREGFENLVEVLRLAGYITSSPSYDTLVDTNIATRVMQAS